MMSVVAIMVSLLSACGSTEPKNETDHPKKVIDAPAEIERIDSMSRQIEAAEKALEKLLDEHPNVGAKYRLEADKTLAVAKEMRQICSEAKASLQKNPIDEARLDSLRDRANELQTQLAEQFTRLGKM
ncbi:hypothetical protein HY224_00415 [Candidatus Uhrbacteria bacterium]|nr:hypothetical protein [Candidatus Uhrbacteria bacterium]